MSQWNKDYDKYIKENTAATNKKIEQRSAGLNQIVDNATNQAVGKVQNEIDKLPTAYQSAYDVNAIQQKINEREVAERMANLGLTNSGLNRTQQTAINIQRSNADAALTQQKNAATASLKQQIADLYASGENQKAQNKLNVYNTYMDELDSSAVAYANNQATNRANIEKARIEAAAKKQERYEKWALENGYTYDAKGDLVKLNGSANAGGNKYKTPTKDILFKALTLKIAKGEAALDEYLAGLGAYDVEAIDDYVRTYENQNNWTVTNQGGWNWGQVDSNGEIKDSYGYKHNMDEFYNQLLAAGMTEAQATKYIMGLQNVTGISDREYSE